MEGKGDEESYKKGQNSVNQILNHLDLKIELNIAFKHGKF